MWLWPFVLFRRYICFVEIVKQLAFGMKFHKPICVGKNLHQNRLVITILQPCLIINVVLVSPTMNLAWSDLCNAFLLSIMEQSLNTGVRLWIIIVFLWLCGEREEIKSTADGRHFTKPITCRGTCLICLETWFCEISLPIMTCSLAIQIRIDKQWSK